MSKKKILNNLKITHPLLCEEWDFEANNGLDPENFSAGSNLKVFWKCKNCGGVWGDTISHRTSGKRGCPYCRGNKLKVGFNDLAHTNPTLINEWSPNNILKPTDVTFKSTKRVLWVCPTCHNEWDATVNERVKGNGCPYCSGHRLKTGVNDLLAKYPEIAKQWDFEKNNGKLPQDFTPGSHEKVWWKCERGHSYLCQINNRVHGTGCPECDKERKTSFPEQCVLFYLSKYFAVKSREKFLDKYEIDVFIPSLNIGIEYDGQYFHSGAHSEMKEKRKNDFLKENKVRLIRIKEIGYKKESFVDNDVIYYSHASSNYENFDWVIKVLLEKLGIETNIKIDIRKDSPLIYSNYLTIEKENSIVTKYPEIAKDWDYELNGGLSPEFVSCHSNKKFYWKCENGHESYLTTPGHRIRGHKCPICSGHKVKAGFNDIAHTHPNDILDWDYQKNKTISPKHISKGSEIKVWWKCHICGHEWFESPSLKLKRGCGKCNRKALKEKQAKKVLNVELNIVFDSLHDAAAYINKPSGISPISNTCKGKRKSAYGYHWRFVE